MNDDYFRAPPSCPHSWRVAQVRGMTRTRGALRWPLNKQYLETQSATLRVDNEAVLHLPMICKISSRAIAEVSSTSSITPLHIRLPRAKNREQRTGTLLQDSTHQSMDTLSQYFTNTYLKWEKILIIDMKNYSFFNITNNKTMKVKNSWKKQNKISLHR